MHAIGEEKWAEFQESQGQKFRNHQRCLHRFSLKDKRNSTFPSTTYLKIACLVPSQSLCSYPHVSHFFNGENWVSIPHRRDHRFHLVRFWWLVRSTKHRVILPPSQGWLLPCYTTKYIYILPVYIYIYIYSILPVYLGLSSSETGRSNLKQNHATPAGDWWQKISSLRWRKKKQVPFTKWKFPNVR